MAVTLPDGRTLRTLFIAGAPRCGSTFLAKALGKHPEICGSKPKETYFFARDAASLPRDRWVRELLRRHYPHRTESHRVLLEGTPTHFYDGEAIRRILDFDPEARFVIAVRNPVDMAPSLHARMRYLLDEDVADFEEAWSLQEARARGEHIPRRCREPHFLQYRMACMLGEHLTRFFEQVGRDRCHVVVFDDLVADPAKVRRNVLEFADLPDDGRTHVRRTNENRDFRHAWAQQYLTNPPAPLRAVLEAMSRRGIQRPRWMREARRRIKKWNTRRAERRPLSPAMRATLQQTFADDVERLGRLLGRDLSHWQ